MKGFDVKSIIRSTCTFRGVCALKRLSLRRIGEKLFFFGCWPLAGETKRQSASNDPHFAFLRPSAGMSTWLVICFFFSPFVVSYFWIWNSKRAPQDSSFCFYSPSVLRISLWDTTTTTTICLFVWHWHWHTRPDRFAVYIWRLTLD